MEWVLEESDAVREVKTEEEKKHYEGKIMYDSKGTALFKSRRAAVRRNESVSVRSIFGFVMVVVYNKNSFNESLPAF